MADVSGTIKKYRLAKKLKQSELAGILGKTANVITNWESGLNRPDLDAIEKMLAIFEIDANEFFGVKKKDPSTLSGIEYTFLKKYRALDEHGKKIIDFTLNAEHERILLLENERKESPEKDKQKNKPDYLSAEPRFEEETETVEMKVYWQPAAAGIGNYLTDEGAYDVLSFAAAEVPQRADFGVRISGDSMEPKISDGDIVWVRAAPQIEDGETGIFILDGNALCKKLQIDYNKRKITLVSLNPNRANIEIHDYENLRTVGKVLLKKY